jgi:HK97 family phage portal protein
MGKKGRAKKSAVEHRDALFSIGDPALADWLGLSGKTWAGPAVNERTSLGLTAVYRAVSLISGTIAGLPLKSYRTDKETGERERVPTFLDDPGGPAGLTPFEWVELVMIHLLLHGNAYLHHLYNAAGAIAGLDPLHPGCVSVRRVNDPWRKEFDVSLYDGSKVTLTPLDLTHIPALGTDGLKGLSPIQLMRQSIGTGLAGDEAAARMFANGLLIGGIVSGDEGLTKEQAEEIRAGLKAKLAGADKAGDIAVVNASLKFSPWTMNADDAQFLQTRVHQVEEVARIFGVPPHLLGQTEKQTSWGTGVSEQNRGLARYTLSSWTSRLEQRLSELLTRPTTCEFDYAGLLQPSPQEEIQMLLEQVAGGLLTIDEARRIRNLPPLPAAQPTPELEVP